MKTMTLLQIQMPDSLTDFVTAQATAQGYATASDYVLALVRAAEQKAEFEAKILEGLESLERGEGTPMTPADWDRMRADLTARYGNGEGA